MVEFRRPEHVLIQRVLQMLRSGLFQQSECWFGGGTAIVLKHGEYRLSRDIDFLCASQAGYRALRIAAQSQGAAGLFDGPVVALREFRCDQYGIRSLLMLGGQPIKFEIVREARVSLSGNCDPELNCPLLTLDDQFTEKLLANADRCHDASVAYRDAFDLGMLVVGNNGTMPEAAVDKSVRAYGDEIWLKLRWVIGHLLSRPSALLAACSALQMDPAMANTSILALREAARRCDPVASFDWDSLGRPDESASEERA